MTDIEWACKWVGWDTYDSPDGLLFKDSADPTWRTDQYGNTDSASLPDLAEAVRVKMLAETNGVTAVWARLTFDWTRGGPEAFISAVREVVDD